MHIDFEEDFGEDESLVHANLRRPLTGKLHIACHEVKDVNHYATARPTKLPDSFITIKVEDQTRAKPAFREMTTGLMVSISWLIKPTKSKSFFMIVLEIKTAPLHFYGLESPILLKQFAERRLNKNSTQAGLVHQKYNQILILRSLLLLVLLVLVVPLVTMATNLLEVSLQ